ncbi:ATP-binding protein [Cytobacillus dafuensis]|uniref:AAA family ATPase n=1 Tax=Cytobacillus dafuensis TaxID=1742359 RepID=A0A5B8Z274_CYTDA|nr:AAA family ATPase [Cytobacillus dafuensis]QED47124.1 AAA family ATPase [Cytobacillus dafuensis]
MRITDIHIYGYGKLSNLKISNLHELQVIFGENEAGKSTIMSFIHSILFGFPTKQQSELRYEPKEGTKYGGQITAFFPEKGRAVIERIKGKAAGDVSVILEDGTRGEEEFLKDLLFHVDKSLFQSIFSFNIHGLQNVHQMRSEDLGRFLFSAGALGTDQLLRAENTLQRELESRFKPNGKKPNINVKLKELKLLHNELKKAELQNEQYWVLLNEKESLEKEINEKQREQLLLQNQLSKLENWRKIHPLIVEEHSLKEELIQYKDIHFPIDGISRLDRLEELMKPLEGQINSISKGINMIEEEIQLHLPDARLLNKENEILAAVERLSLLEKLKQEEKELQDKLYEIQQEEVVLREKLHLNLNEEQLLSINTSVFMKEKVIAAQEKSKRIKSRKLDLDERFHEEKQRLEETEEQLKLLESQLLPESERKKLEEELRSTQKMQDLEQELIQIDTRLDFLYKTQNSEKERLHRKKNQEKYQLSIFCFLFFALIAWGVMEASWPIIIIGVLGVFYSISMFFKKSTEGNNNFVHEELTSLKNRKKLILQKLNEPSMINAAKMEDRLEKDKRVLERLHQFKFLWEQRNEQYEKVIIDFESWEKEMVKHENVLVGLGDDLFLPRDLALSHIADAFLFIEQLKKLYRERKVTFERHNSISIRITEIQNGIVDLCNAVLDTIPTNIQEMAYMLRNRLKVESEKKIKLEGRKAKLSDLEEELQRYKLEYEHFQIEREKLFQSANSESEEQYREIGKLADKRAKLDEQIESIRRQLKLSPFNDTELKEYMKIADVAQLISSQSKLCVDLKEKIPLLQNRLAEKKYEVQLLEEGGTFAELLHLYKQKKSELEGEAREWAKFALAKDILDRTIESFKNDRLPQMLKRAEEYLQFLTDNKYVRIYPKKEGIGFLLENDRGLLFEANELSQATTEQLFVALRLALAVTVYGRFPFPIIIDDSFVNFDHIRTEKVINLLKSLSSRQIIFFTCHKHMLPYFEENQVAFVNKKESLPI